MAAVLDGGKLRLSGTVGDDWFGDGFTSADVVWALAEVDDAAALDVHLNSPGGVATEGEAIRALLAGRSGPTHVVIEGIAASAASIIAMAGTRIVMTTGSVLMIHEPETAVMGRADDIERAAGMLHVLSGAYARVYAARSGKSEADCLALMAAETWFDAARAVEEGFADEVAAIASPAVAAFDYRAFAHAPAPLVALAAAKRWSMPAEKQALASAGPREQKDSPMPEKISGGGDAAAELERLRTENATLLAEKADRERTEAVMALPEATGREALAAELAKAGLSVAQAKAALSAAPQAKSASDEPDLSEYERQRAVGAGLQGSGQSQAKRPVIDRKAIFDMRAGRRPAGHQGA